MQPVNFYQENLHAFQQRIAKIPSISDEQVCFYAKQVRWREQLKKLRQDLRQDHDADPTFAEWAYQAQLSEAALNDALKAGDRARQKLIESHLTLVVAIARRYQNRGVELLDLIQEGSVGLDRGVKRFDPNKGYKFSTYVYWWIRQAITRTIAENSKKGTLVRNELTEILEKFESDLPQPVETAVATEQQTLVGLMVSQLPPREREVMRLSYGLIDGLPRSPTETGKEMGLSRYQVHRLRTKALQTLKKDLAQGLSLDLLHQS